MEEGDKNTETTNSTLNQAFLSTTDPSYIQKDGIDPSTTDSHPLHQTVLENSTATNDHVAADSALYEDLKGQPPGVNDVTQNCDKTDQSASVNPDELPESFMHELRFLIFTQNAGGLIGKGAEKIRMFREKYNVNVNVPMSHSSLRVAVVTGKKTPLLSALKEILPCMRKAPFDMFQDKELQINLLVPEPFAPIIIGTGGSRISNLRKETNCGIKIFDENLPYCTERMVVLAGSLNNIIQVIQTFLVHFENNNFPKKTRRFDCTRLEYDEILHMMRLRGGSKFENDNRYPPNYPPSYMPPRYDYYPPPQLPPPSMPMPIYDDGPIRTIQVSVNSKDAGTVIGASGSRIREIRERTMCKIEMDEALPGCGVRVITLTGTDRAINNAQYYMQTCIRENEKTKRKRKGKVGKE